MMFPYECICGTDDELDLEIAEIRESEVEGISEAKIEQVMFEKKDLGVCRECGIRLTAREIEGIVEDERKWGKP